MKFSLRQMQVFNYVAEYQSVSEAAKELNMSQSAASMALSQLESMLEKPLFIRQGRKMKLNNSGLWLRPHVHQLLSNCHTIELGMKDRDLVSGLISLGASQTPAEHLVPALVTQLDQDFPHLQVDFGVENTEHVIQGLHEYRYDLGIIEGHCDDESMDVQKLCEDELVIVASAQHAYAQGEQTSLTQLEMAQWILRERGAGTREIFDISIHEHIDQLNVHREYDHVGVIVALVADGNYLTCLSRRSVHQAVSQGVLAILNVPELNMVRDFSFVWRKSEGSSASRVAMIKTAKTLAAAKHQLN
jgi:DNA-binding transcriptional LysR family regulator